MEQESFRTVTSKSTIPAGTAGTGTITTNGSDNTRLNVAGGVLSEFDKVRHNSYRNIWIYAVTSHKIALVKSILTVSGTTTFQILTDRAMTGIAGEAFTIIIGDLLEWSATNQSGATGYISGEPIIVGQTVNSFYKNLNSGVTEQCDVEIIDGTGASFTVIETR